jgi:hypothetical protein
MHLLDIIAHDAEKVVKEIKDYSRMQKRFWQKIPLLALEADGRTGFLGIYSTAYKEGFWALNSSIKDGKYSVYVNLATGDLIDAYNASGSFSVSDIDVPKKSKLVPASKKDILTLAFNLHELDAKRIIAQLMDEAQIPYPSYYNSEKQEAWRKKTRKELGLKEDYVR